MSAPLRLVANLSLLYVEMPFMERFAAAAADGFAAVEIQFPYDTPAALIRAELDRLGLQCVLINVPAGDLMSGGRGLACVPGQEAEFENALALCADYVQVLYPLKVNVLAGRCQDAAERPQYLNCLEASLRKALAVLEPLGAGVVFECINTTDMPGFLLSTMADAGDMLSRVADTSIRLQFDIYHMAMMGEAVEDLLRAHSGVIGHIQFADMPGRHEPGTGSLDFTRLIAAIAESGYDGWVAAEYRPEGASTSAGLGWRSLLPG